MADNQAQGEMLIRREEANLERRRAKLAASEENMKSTLAALFKNEEVHKALALEAINLTKNPSRRDELLDKSAGGLYNDDGVIVTGKEPRPWED